MGSNLDPYGELCLAVGNLILDFAKLENAVSAGLRLHLTFRLEPKKDTDSLSVAAAVYGSLRLKTSTMIMRRLMVQERAVPVELALFDAVFDHVGHINTLRDKFAHQALSAASGEDDWELSDLVTTRALDSQLKYEIRTADVIAACKDLQKAYDLTKHFLTHPGVVHAGDLPKPPAWQYKPSALRLVRPKRGRAHQ